MKRKKVELIYWLFISLTVLSIPVIYGQAPSRDNFNFVFENDFENDQLGSYLHSDFISDWNLSSSSFLAPQEIINLIIDPDSKYNKVMRGYFPIGTFKIATQGFFWPSPVSPQRTELYLSYDIKFKPGFEWVLGGKIPGLVGGPFVTGRQPGPTDGFSTRPVWKDGGKLASYVYHQDQDITFGNMYYWGSYVGGVWQNFTFTSGKWYNLTIRVVLNTIGSNNGIMEGWINGKLLFKKTNFKFRSLESIKIDYMYIASFFGGSTTDWATIRDEWIDTDNYVAFTYSSKPTNVPRGFEASSSTRALLHPYYNFSTATGSSVPNAPTSLSTTAITKSSISLKWTDNSTNEQGFKLYRSLSSTNNFTEIAALNANLSSYTDSTLQPTTTYYYRINAYNSDGSSTYTPVLQATTSLLDLPAAPSLLTSTGQTDTSVKLNWKDNSKREKGFKLYRSTTETGSFIEVGTIVANITSYTDNSLQPATNYYYKLNAYNLDGSSEYTPVYHVTTKISVSLPPAEVFIDPDNINDELADGSVDHPFDSWDDITWVEGSSYFQKRGTTSQVEKILIGASRVSLGAYGEGELPVISSNTDTYLMAGFDKYNIKIQNLSLQSDNAESCVYFMGSTCDSIIIDHCKLTSNGFAIKMASGKSLAIKYTTITSEYEGINSTALGNDIHYNIFKNCSTAVNVMSNQSKANIFNNVFIDNGQSILVSYAELTIYNNIFYMNGPNQKAITFGSGKLSSDNNIFFPEHAGFVKIADVSFNNLQQLQQNNGTDLNSFTSDPRFVDMNNNNFSVAANSPAINAGKDLNLEKDFKGINVPVAGVTDIGIIEYTGAIFDKDGGSGAASVMSLYPNPSTGKVNILAEIVQEQPDADFDWTELKVLDITGRPVIVKQIARNGSIIQDNIDLSGIPNGLYLFILQVADKVIKEKLLINK